MSPLVLFSAQTPVDYIIDTDIGGDIDDALALLVAITSDNKPLALTTTHIEPLEKARIAKLILSESGYPDIPVYAGVGVTRQDPNEEFLALNSL
ncbi:nucleoside hydrolase [Legionella hackeliae]|uniref:nucleoside hydrolase n=1 Tax=Legionella hackeliae TaxID=449 RepID=UPI0013153967|nr:nucleoside hydrolase [Legionella hackeliae]